MLGEKLIRNYSSIIETIPSIQYLWKEAQHYVNNRDEEMVKKYQNLIYFLHSSFVSPYTKLGENVKFGYGGIGVVLHKDSIVGDNVVISQNFTIGGTPGSAAVDDSGVSFFVPRIGSNVYISSGAKVIGAIVIGDFCVIGANSVVLKDTDSFSIYAGNPAKKIKKINKDNCIKYRSFFSGLSSLSKDDFINLFPE